MARLLWGCYSVADHLEPRAFVLLYDRLVIPTPSADDMARWEQRWDPERQARLLGILGPTGLPGTRSELSPVSRGEDDLGHRVSAQAEFLRYFLGPYPLLVIQKRQFLLGLAPWAARHVA